MFGSSNLTDFTPKYEIIKRIHSFVIIDYIFLNNLIRNSSLILENISKNHEEFYLQKIHKTYYRRYNFKFLITDYRLEIAHIK